ncbi:MAG: D-glycero-beta-D-manno-heptose 1-phosphate adenylyltransferase [Planctomycetes bacterium]|nr:D-glycero-beta-D-manno-heptose 1-phosphate adenylyltransferase [Planctomycetota bacterium]
MLDPLAPLIRKLGRPRILVAGDLIVDHYVFGDVDRVSPEAPIQVLRVASEERRLGGAGNVAHNLHALGARPALLGVVGADSAGEWLTRALSDVVPGGVHLVSTPNRPTTEKTRFLSRARSQQLLRVDREEPAPLAAAIEARAVEAIDDALEDADALIVSDYGKGFLGPRVVGRLIAGARRRRIPTFVDPKGADWSRYRGATWAMPNRAEAAAATGLALRDDAELERAAARLVAELGLEGIVVTLGPDGMLVKRGNAPAVRVPSVFRPVYDVTGAGDTAIAAFALSITSGVEPVAAASIASLAASVVVGKVGTATASREELVDLVSGAPREPKIVTAIELRRAIEARRRLGQRVVFTNGCFDLLHAGHVGFLRFARAQGDALVVAVNDDRSVRRNKGSLRPVQPLSDRMEILASLEPVDFVVAFGEKTPLRLIRDLHPDVLVKGEDWREKGVVGSSEVESWGGRVVLAPLLAGRSTTRVIERVMRTRDARPRCR